MTIVEVLNVIVDKLIIIEEELKFLNSENSRKEKDSVENIKIVMDMVRTSDEALKKIVENT